MWLPETAVDMETLDIMAECGIMFTILAAHQAARVRKTEAEKWKEIGDEKIDPSRTYFCSLPSGRRMNIFFYDGPIARAVAFEGLLAKGEDLVNRLLTGFSEARKEPQMLNIATDGESYGHHHRFGDMALAYALHQIDSKALARLTNYAEYLEKNPPLHEVQIKENTSWSCIHGIERWKNNCGCNSGGHQGWNQKWRAPLREAIDWLRDQLSPMFEGKAKEYLKDPWAARDDYIGVTIDRSPESIGTFLRNHALKEMNGEEKSIVLKLMEMERHAMLMYTSCGWFFDELSGTETIQVMQYAGRAIQLAQELFGVDLENTFKDILSKAKSNMTEHADGSHVYDKFVKRAMVDLRRVTAHYAISSLIKDYGDAEKIYSYQIKKEEYQRVQSGAAKLAVGLIRVTSDITFHEETVGFCALFLGGHIFNSAVKAFPDNEAYQLVKQEIIAAFEGGEVPDVIRLLDNHFGKHTYSLSHLFRDEQRKILNFVSGETLEQFEHAYRLLYENHLALMAFYHEAGIPVPVPFLAAAAFIYGGPLSQDKKTRCI